MLYAIVSSHPRDLPAVIYGLGVVQDPAGIFRKQAVQVGHRPAAVEESVLRQPPRTFGVADSVPVVVQRGRGRHHIVGAGKRPEFVHCAAAARAATPWGLAVVQTLPAISPLLLIATRLNSSG